MAIRAPFLLAVGGFLAVLASGITMPSAAEPLAFQAPEIEAVPRDEFGPAASPVERAGDEGGSAADLEAAEPPETFGLVEVDSDPWAEAFAGSRLAPWAWQAADYPMTLNNSVRRFLDRYTNDRREVVSVWLGRSGRYLAMIRDVFRTAGLPDELAFVPMVESGYNPLAVSRAGAKGLWQFMAATARRYGMRVDGWVDERLDPEKSTRAAAAYLRDLYQQFGTWALAKAAYNAGEATVTRAIHSMNSRDFWTLVHSRHLRQETKEFVPQIHAATMIGRDPGQYGFEVPYDPPLPVDRVAVPPATNLGVLAVRAGIPSETLKALNPVLVRGVTPPGRAFDLKVPAGVGPEVLAALNAPVSPLAAPTRSGPPHPGEVHVVRPRETLGAIAKQHGLAVAELLRLNGGKERIRPGDRLRLTDARVSADRTGHATIR
jgi:membrane-bound lytic murein transglycosylase D